MPDPSPSTSDAPAAPLFKKRTARRPNTIRERASASATPEPAAESSAAGEESPSETLEEMLALRKFKRSGGPGIDTARLNKGDDKGKRRKVEVEKKDEGSWSKDEGGMVDNMAKLKDAAISNPQDKIIKGNNFTGQTNALDVDKHMMAYIETELRKRRGGASGSEEITAARVRNPHDELYAIAERYRVQQAKPVEEGNVTTSMAMLTQIPEVDLGMENRLKNIEATEKAKRALAEQRAREAATPTPPPEEGYTAAARFYRPQLTVQSDAEALRNAKLEAMGQKPVERPAAAPKQEYATDEAAVERFKKRMAAQRR